VSLSAAYERFVRRLLESDFAWENPEEEPPQPATASQIPGQKATKYDAFLSYNNSDVKTVSQVRSRLSASGIKSFFPQVDIAPGADMMASRARAMSESKAVIIFVGPAGLGPWQEQETLAELESFFKDSSKLIVPVLLPKAPDLDALRLPNFLRRFQWLDLREGVTDDQAMGNLI